MSFSIGSNDCAGLSTSYGAKAASLGTLLVLGGIGEFIGAMYCADKVTETLTDDIIPDIGLLPADLQRKMMMAVMMATFTFIITTAIVAMPISGTHAVIGSLLGSGIMAIGVNKLNFFKLIKIVCSWFLSPALAALLTYNIMIVVCEFTLNT